MEGLDPGGGDFARPAVTLAPMYAASLPLAAAISLAAVLVLTRVARQVLALPSKPVLWSLIGLAAVGAALAPGAATGVIGVDVVLRAGFAVACTLAASRSARWAWLVASGVAAAASPGQPFALAGFVALGLTVGSLLSGRRARGPVLGALVGALSAQGLLRLSFSPLVGVSAGLAAVGAIALVVSGFHRASRRWRHRARGGAFALGALGAGAVILAAVGALTARSPAALGFRDAQAGVAAARAGNAAGAARDLARAAQELRTARGDLGTWWTWPGRLVPVVSQNVRALALVSAEGAQVATAGANLASATLATTAHASAGSVPLARLTALGAPAARSLAVSHQAAAVLAGLRSPWLVPPLVHRLHQLEATLGALGADQQALALATKDLPAFLGGDGPRRYLLVVQDPVELRGGGGVIGDEAVLVADQGRLSLTGLQPTSVPPPDAAPLRVDAATAAWARGQQIDVTRYPQDDTFSPDFPTDARLLEQSAAQLGLAPVDGVISVDPTALAALLQITGPVAVPGWPVPLSAANAVPVLLHDQYDVLAGQARQAFLTAATGTIFEHLTRATLPEATTLAGLLGPVVAAKHLLVYANDPAGERFVATLGAAGAMPAVHGDFLEVVTQDGTANKIDWYLRRSVADHVTYDPASGAVQATVTIGLANRAPASGQPAYVIGPDGTSGLPAGTSRLLVSVYSPLGFAGGTVAVSRDPVRALLMSAQVVQGRRAYSAFVDIPPGRGARLVLHLSGRIPAGAQYRLDLADQPAVAPDRLRVSVRAPGPWQAKAGAGMEVRGDQATFRSLTNRDQHLSVVFGRG